MYSYCFKAAENYRDIFKLIYVTEIERFNSCLYFYYINNGIDPLAVIVDLSRVLLLLKKDRVIQSCLKNYRTELSKQKDTGELYYLRVNLVLLALLNQADKSGLSLLIYYLGFIVKVKVRSVYGHLIYYCLQDRSRAGSFRSRQGTMTWVGEACSGVILPPVYNIQIGCSFGRVQAFYSYVDWSATPESIITQIGQ